MCSERLSVAGSRLKSSTVANGTEIKARGSTRKFLWMETKTTTLGEVRG